MMAEVEMNKEDIIKFVKEFNKSKALSTNDIVECLKKLSKEDHELFIMMVNYKNGKDFLSYVQKGDNKCQH